MSSSLVAITSANNLAQGVSSSISLVIKSIVTIKSRVVGRLNANPWCRPTSIVRQVTEAAPMSVLRGHHCLCLLAADRVRASISCAHCALEPSSFDYFFSLYLI